MTDRKLHLIFDHTRTPVEADPAWTVLVHESGEGSAHPGISSREFYGNGYELEGYDFCLWWHRLLSQPGHEGKCLHDLASWEGHSALWWSHLPFLYPDFGIFPRALCARQAVSLFRKGEISEVVIQGNESPLADTLRENRLACRLDHEPEMQSSSRLRGRWKKIQSSLHWFILSRWWRWRLKENHQADQSECLLYSIWPNEWQLPGDGSHRYLGDTLEEVLDHDLFRVVRPLVYCAPSLQDEKAWKEFLHHSLISRQGVYGISYGNPWQVRKIQSWARQVEAGVEKWLEQCPPEQFEFKSVQLGPLFRASLIQALRALPLLVLRYEALKKCLQEIRPGALLLKDEVYPDGRLLVAASKAAGIRSVSLQHGAIYPAHWCYIMDREAQGISKPPLPDAFGVYGDSAVQLLSERGGFPREILRAVGARRFRHLLNCRVSEELNSFRGENPLVLVAGQMHQDMGRIYEWCFKLAAELERVRFVFKPHPRDLQRKSLLEQKCGGLRNTAIFSGPLGAVLPLASITLSGHSTVLLESVWMKVPALSIQISGETPAEWQLRAGILRVVRSYAEMTTMIQEILGGDFFHQGDFQAAADYLEEFLGFSACQTFQAVSDLFKNKV